MKNRILISFVICLLGHNIKAQDIENYSEESASMSVKANQELITYEFHSILDLEENTDAILDELVSDTTTEREVTVEIIVTVNNGTISKVLSWAITARNTDVPAAAKKLRKQLIQAISS